MNTASHCSVGLKFDEIIAFLNRAVSDGEPVMLMGVSSSYLYLFDYLHEHDLTFALAPDSRLFDTGACPAAGIRPGSDGRGPRSEYRCMNSNWQGRNGLSHRSHHP